MITKQLNAEEEVQFNGNKIIGNQIRPFHMAARTLDGNNNTHTKSGGTLNNYYYYS